MRNRVANKAILQPFSVLRTVGFSSRGMQRLNVTAQSKNA
jgi:hypothetical protein